MFDEVGPRVRAQRASLVRDLLREHLLSGGLRPGQCLPCEHTLGQQLGCSRNVLREALALLAADGLVRRERGRGTYLLSTGPAIPIDSGFDLAAALTSERGPVSAEGQQSAPDQVISYRVLQMEIVRASSVLSGLLGQPAGAPVMHVERLAEFAGTRVGHWDLHLRLPVGALSRIGALAGTLNTADLLRELGLTPETEEVRLEAMKPSPRTAELLYQGRPELALRMSRRFLDADASVLALAIGRCVLPGATFAMVRRCAPAKKPA